MYKKIVLIMIISMQCLYADKFLDIKRDGVINVGVKYDFKPFGFIDHKSRLIGFDIEIAKIIAKKLDVSIKFFQVTSKDRIPRLLNGDIDIIVASMTHKISRDKEIDFSISYFFDGQSMLVRVDEMGTSYKDFEKRKIGVIKGSTSGPNFKKLMPKAKLVYFSEYPQALRALNKGNIDAITTDSVWCMTQAKDSNDKLKVIGEKLSYEPYGIGINHNESRLRDNINLIIQDMVNDGTYIKLYQTWFGIIPTKLPLLWPK